MQLPFTHDQFLEVFAAYNTSLWPVAVVLWILTLGAILYLYRRGAEASRLVATLLALHWVWSGVVYNFAFFRDINPAATLFAAMFVLQAVLFAWRGVVQRHLTFFPSRSSWGLAGAFLVVYALAYPALGLLFGLDYPRMPLFGVPCPTTILTAGLLLFAPRHEARLLAAIPVLWTAIGGSAAVLLGIRADLMLPVAGVLVLAYVLTPAREPQAATS